MSEELEITVDVSDSTKNRPEGFPKGKCLTLQIQVQETTLGLFWVSLESSDGVISSMIDILLNEISDHHIKV